MTIPHLIRLLDPYLIRELGTDLKLCWTWVRLRILRCRWKEQLSKVERKKNESLFNFLNSAFNVEYVYLILVGINACLENIYNDDS
jgi:hypothetical protein